MKAGNGDDGGDVIRSPRLGGRPGLPMHVVQDQSAAIAFLQGIATPSAAEPITRIETQSAIVFLAGEDAYKLKRAVRLPFMDFSTVEKRRQACQAEIAINRAAAPAIYLGVLPITDRNGTLMLGGDGTAVDWVVHMRRFDENQTLDRIAEVCGLSLDLIANVVDVVLTSHRRAPRRDANTAIASLEDCIRQNDQAFAEMPGLFTASHVRQLTDASNEALARIRPVLAARGEAGLVRRCHGDLHLRNIVLLHQLPTLFDAIEFDEGVATTDVLYDLAFLIMDLWQRDLTRLANTVLNRYLWHSEDAHLDGLVALPLFLSLRAAIRAKVVSADLAHLSARERAATSHTVRQYFDLARSLLSPEPARLVAIGGLSGTGKSTVAARLAPRIGRPPGAIHLRSDVERKRIFSVPLTEKLPASAYSKGVTDSAYKNLRLKAGRVLDAGYSAIVDAVHAGADERSTVDQVAAERGVPFIGLWLEAPLEQRLRRVADRSGDVSDATPDVVRRQASYDVGFVTWARLDAGRDEAATAEAAASAVGIPRPPAVATARLPDMRLLDALTDLASRAAAKALSVRSRPLDISAKADGSPVTNADEAVEDLLLEGLGRLCPGIPIVSEETRATLRADQASERFALVDPLDGTIEFIDGRDDFTINIAIVEDRIPILGIVASPARGTLWRGLTDVQAERCLLEPGASLKQSRNVTRISTRRAVPDGKLVAVISRSHLDDETAEFLNGMTGIRTTTMGSSLKFCRVAEGSADVYPRFGTTSEWDIAAGHAIVTAAGGAVVTPVGEAIMYGRADADFKVPSFIAWGDPNRRNQLSSLLTR
jgi:3'(2'),5'-bisphosphate nucleotidase